MVSVQKPSPELDAATVRFGQGRVEVEDLSLPGGLGPLAPWIKLPFAACCEEVSDSLTTAP